MLILALLLPPFLVAGEETTVEAQIDWSRGLVSLRLSAPLPSATAPLPVVKLQLQKELESQFPIHLRTALAPLLVDSRRMFAEALPEEPSLLAAVTHAGEGLPPIQVRLTEDLKFLNLSYQFTLFPDIIRPLLPESHPDSLPMQLGYEPSAPFTGIVIYAADPLPVHGERDERGEPLTETIAPCLLPRIFDEEMNLIFSAHNMESFYRETWGVFQYTPSLDPMDRRSRVGEYPYYTMAVGLFGIHNTDIILSTEAVRKLLSREDTRQLLREGRITVITSP